MRSDREVTPTATGGSLRGDCGRMVLCAAAAAVAPNGAEPKAAEAAAGGTEAFAGGDGTTADSGPRPAGGEEGRDPVRKALSGLTLFLGAMGGNFV